MVHIEEINPKYCDRSGTYLKNQPENQSIDAKVGWIFQGFAREFVAGLEKVRTIVRDLVYGDPKDYVAHEDCMRSNPQDFKSINVQFNKNENQGLIIGVHGLGGTAAMHDKTKEAIEGKDALNGMAFRRLKVLKKGNCPHADAAQAVVNMVLKYGETFGRDKPIVLIGNSNGAPISLEAELQLREQGFKIHIVTIAGANRGTILMTILSYIGIGDWNLARMLFGKDAVKNLSLNSPVAQGLEKRLKETQIKKGGLRSYTVYRNKFDGQVHEKNLSCEGSCFTWDGIDAKYFKVYGTMHNSIVAAVADHLADQVVERVSEMRETEAMAL